ncbi:MAG: O-antigen ligase family protein [Verrucomicrobia bacterium]|nr:O-antigen ligase family protein [Verrucomicrobiota bacterium]
MPPVLALFLTVGFIVFLFRRESREKVQVSRALWIPVIWLFLTGSRFASQWMSLSAYAGAGSVADGSPLDALVFLTLIVAGVNVLKQRHVTYSEFLRNNRWLTIFFIYSLISIVWSDFPFIAAKRWIKVVGHPVMVLIILTDAHPQQAVRTLFKRLAYLLIPLSILFIKYFPQYGRGFDAWSGDPVNCGVALTKNELGCICWIFGVFFFWNLLQALKMKPSKARRAELLLSAGFLLMDFWLLQMASSATSMLVMMLGMAIILALGFRFVNKRLVGAYVVLGIVALVVAEPIFGIYATVVHSMGRNLTLTDRTDVWQLALQLQPNPLLGSGFESFWLGTRLEKLWAKFWWQPLQAHNGYIETYLNLGWAGIALLIGQIVDTFRKICAGLTKQFEFARLRMGFLFAILVYNYTEAAFVAVAFAWTIFFLIAVDYPAPRRARSKEAPGSAGDDKREAAPVLAGT